MAVGGELTETPTPGPAERGGRSPRPSPGCCGAPQGPSPGGGMTAPLSVCQVLLLYGPFTEPWPELADCSASGGVPPEPTTLPQEDGEYAVAPAEEGAPSDSRWSPWEPGAAATG